jgi:hypothetical protein
VRDVTDGAVLLDIDGKTAARYTDIATADYIMPDAAWPPPHPYRQDAILFAPEHAQPAADEAEVVASPPLDALEYGVGARPLADVVMPGP